MPCEVAVTTKRNAVIGIVSKAWVWPPRLDVVDFEFSAAFATVLARPVVAGKAGCAELFISEGIVVFISDCGRPIDPVRVVYAYKVFTVIGRLASSTLTAFSDFTLVFLRKTFPFFGFRDTTNRLLSGFWSHHVAVSAQRCGGGNLGPCRIGFRRVRRAVDRFHLAGMPAKVKIPPRFLFTTLNAK